MNNKIIIVVKIRKLSYQKGNTFVIPSFLLFGLWTENLNVSGADSFKFSWEKTLKGYPESKFL